MSKFAEATLYYGRRAYRVMPNETLPFPEEFDFQDVEGCARKVLAIMSNASGGHTIRDCRVHVHLGQQTATIIGDGVAVHYMPAERTKFTAEQALQIMRERVTTHLGSVRTDQYGEGWKRAVWS